MNVAVDMDPVQRWYANATVRNRSRILVPDAEGEEYIFPRTRQPLSEHPKVVALGDKGVNYVLAQSTYKYMYEIGLLETKYVIDCGLKIVNDQIMPGKVTESDKLDALTIVIDEGYHAHVALDFIIQMKQKIGVSPISVPQTNGNLNAVSRAFAALPESAHSDFELISVCLAEHTLTKDLLAIGREKEASRTFTQVMTDHVSDEGRHANYFASLVKRNWTAMSEENRLLIGSILPAYLDDYLAGDEERTFDREVIEACGLSREDVEEVLRDTSASYYEAMHSYIAETKANLINLLRRMGVLDHAPTKAAFDAHLAQAAAAN